MWSIFVRGQRRSTKPKTRNALGPAGIAPGPGPSAARTGKEIEKCIVAYLSLPPTTAERSLSSLSGIALAILKIKDQTNWTRIRCNLFTKEGKLAMLYEVSEVKRFHDVISSYLTYVGQDPKTKRRVAPKVVEAVLTELIRSHGAPVLKVLAERARQRLENTGACSATEQIDGAIGLVENRDLCAAAESLEDAENTSCAISSMTSCHCPKCRKWHD